MTRPPRIPDLPGSVNKEFLARALIAIREASHWTQSQLARRAGWPNSVASRIESPHGSLPDLTTLARFAWACELEAGLLFATPHDSFLHVHSALTLQSTPHHHLYERFHGEPLLIPSAATPDDPNDFP